MTLAEDFRLRNSDAQWFDGQAHDHDGCAVKMYSVVTPIGPVSQSFEAGAEPILLEPGTKLVVIGAADRDLGLLWFEVDHKDHVWADANVVLPSSAVRYLCEVGDDPHLKARP